MRRMGIDASTKCTGYCIFEDKKLITYGKLSPTNSKDMTWRERVIWMMKHVSDIIQNHHIQQICLEVPIKTLQNVVTLEQLFTLQGAILGISIANNAQVVTVEVNQWRKELGISKGIVKDNKKNSRAILKQRSIELANELYDLDLVWKSTSSKFNDDDISDAILICHSVIHRQGLNY